MEVGSLFFKLGFKGDGGTDGKRFEDTLTSIDQVALRLTESLEKMATVLEKIAIKMGAIEAPLEPSDAGRKFPPLKLVTEDYAPKVKTAKDLLDDVGKKLTAIGDKARMAFPIVEDQVRSVIPAISGLASKLVAAGVAITFLGTKAGQYALELSRFSGLTGLSTLQLQDLQAKAAASGYTIEQLGDTIKSLQKTAIDIRMGRADGTPWMLLGISPSMDPFETFERLQKAMRTMGEAKFTYFAQNAGLSEDMINLLREMREGPEAKKRFLLTEAEVKSLKEFTLTANVAGTDFKNVMIKLGAALAPFAKAIMTVFSGLTNIFGQLILGIKGVFDWIGLTTEKVLFLATALAAAFAVPGLGIAAFILLIEDLIAYFNGEDSVLGRAINNIKILFTSLFEMVSWQFKSLTLWFERLLNSATPLTDLLKGMGNFFFGAGEPDLFPKAPAASLGPNNVSSQSQTNNVNIQVDGSKDPVTTSKEVYKVFNQQMSNGYIQQPMGNY